MASSTPLNESRFARAWWRRWAWLGWLLALAGIVRWLTATPSAAASRPVEGEYSVRQIINGDTLMLSNGARVRLQGIDTPETVEPIHPLVRLKSETAAFVDAFVEQADSRVRLTFGAERIDRDGRWLAFVWRGERLLNEELVRTGLAEARLDHRHAGKMKRRLRDAQDEAREARRGIWSSRPAPSDETASNRNLPN